MEVGYVTHDESMIETFIEDPKYAEELLNDVLIDGNDYEINRVQAWYDEAQARRKKAAPDMSYWDNLNENVKIAVKNGLNLRQILSYLNDAVRTVKAAMA